MAALALAAGACDAPLDTDPAAAVPMDGSLDEPAEVRAAVLGAYDALQTEGLYSRNTVVYPELYADNLDFTGTYSTDLQVDLRSIAPSSSAVLGIWEAAYQAVNRANAVVAAVDGVEGLSADEAARFRGEALFLRGLVYFDLVRFFGGVPLVTEPTTDLDDVDAAASERASQAQVYARVVADLEEAAGLLPPGVTPGRANRWAAEALLAKVYLELGRWADAEAAATAVIGSGRYRLVGDYKDLFAIKNSPESIFEVQYSVTDANAHAFWAFPSSLGGRRGYAPSDALYEAYEENDARRDVTIGVDDDDGLYGRKFFRISNGDDNVIVLRLAEAYLARAEARARQGDFAGARADVDVVRERAGLGPLPETVDTEAELIAAIVAERRVELALEGHRFFDLRRTGLLGSFLPASTRTLFPIPQAEIDVNDKLTQNPGY